MSSQKQSSPSSFLRGQMARVADLEAQLAAKLSEEKASRIRIQLCEVLSDVLLTDPQFALRKDCSGRLWRHCFYARIVELRNRISREKRKKGPSLQKLEHSLKVFLKEAIVLYDYLVEKYEAKLLPNQSQESLSQQTASTDTAGVVPGLHRILIHLGDLHRYATSYSQAEKCYDRASKLAPGKGNPYNQLAVVAQLKDPSAPLSCVALYYYARSLMATNDPFETSKANLSRLLESNREWLQNASEQDLLAAAKGDKARAIKTVQSRLFLARFVDLHYDFFRAGIPQAELVVKMQVVALKLEAMLKEWAFGDSLLSKMVTINAFSVEWTAKQNDDKSASEALARAFMLTFGAALAERLEQGLQKALEKNTPSVRLLLPLLLLCDFVGTLPDSPKDETLDKETLPYCADARERFWNQIARVASKIYPLRDNMGLDEISDMRLKEYDNLRGFAPFDSFAKIDSESSYISVEEAVRVLELTDSATQESTFSDKSTSGVEENPIKLKRFVEFLEKMVNKKCLTRTADGQFLVASLVEEDPIVEDDDEMEDDPIVEFESSGPSMNAEYEKQPSSTAAGEMGQVNDVMRRFPIPTPQNDDQVLVYKKPDSGTGPALLVPGAILLNEATTANQDQRRTVAADSSQPLVEPELPAVNALLFETATKPPAGRTDVPMDEERPVVPQMPLGPPPGILPPPGFGAPVAAAPTFSVPPPTHAPFQGYAMFPPANSGLIAFGHPPGYSQPTQHQSDGDTVLHMLRGMDVYSSSANPFLVPPTSGSSRLFSSQSSLYSDHDMDGSSLLDSSLLSSMLMDESNSQPRSKNPFLT